MRFSWVWAGRKVPELNFSNKILSLCCWLRKETKKVMVPAPTRSECPPTSLPLFTDPLFLASDPITSRSMISRGTFAVRDRKLHGDLNTLPGDMVLIPSLYGGL